MHNNIFRLYLFLIYIFLFPPLLSIEKRLDQVSLKTSVVIPCYYKHAQYLPALLESFKQQTVLPDEVVISLSQQEKAPDGLVESINSTSYPFAVILLLDKNRISEGGNFNNACAHASGDIFITQHADDLSHRQRIEVIKYFFENYHIDHLRHVIVKNYKENENQLPDSFKIEEIPWYPPHKEYQCWKSFLKLSYGNGQFTISRQAFDAVKWNQAFATGLDVEYNKRVYDSFPNTCIIIDAELYLHRKYLSSYLDGVLNE